MVSDLKHQLVFRTTAGNKKCHYAGNTFAPNSRREISQFVVSGAKRSCCNRKKNIEVSLFCDMQMSNGNAISFSRAYCSGGKKERDVRNPLLLSATFVCLLLELVYFRKEIVSFSATSAEVFSFRYFAGWKFEYSWCWHDTCDSSQIYLSSPRIFAIFSFFPCENWIAWEQHVTRAKLTLSVLHVFTQNSLFPDPLRPRL